MSAVQKSWLRILAEGTAILVSILLAFFIDAQWDLKQERERASGILSSLEAAYAENLAMTDEGLGRIAGDLLILNRFLTLTPATASQVPADTAAQMIQNLWRPGPPNPNNDFVLALLDAESISSLRDPQVREAIARWRTHASSVSARRAGLGSIEEDMKRALGRHEAIRPLLADPIESREARPSALLAALQDEDLRGLASVKAGEWAILVFALRNLREESESVLEAIRQGGTE